MPSRKNEWNMFNMKCIYEAHSHIRAAFGAFFLLRFSAEQDRSGKATIKRTRRRKLAETIKIVAKL